MKKLIIVVLLLFPSLALGAEYTADSCSYADVNGKYADSVTSGDDILNIPAGDCTWNSTLTISHGGQFMGAGTDNTIIRNGTGGTLIYFNPSNYSANESFRMSGIYFDFNSSGQRTFRIGNSKSAPFTVQDKFRVDHNVFDEMTGTSAFWNYGVAYGVIDNNRFEYSSGNYPFKNDPAIADNYDWWVDSPQHDYELGSEKNLYWEDNVINLNGTNETAGAECQYGGRYAFRYNEFNANGPSYNFFEQHGHQDDMPSCFGMEIYGNDITATNDDMYLSKSRGGRSVLFGNSGSNLAGRFPVNVYTSLIVCPDEDPNGQMVNGSFQWANRRDYDGALSETTGGGNIDGCGEFDDRPMLGRDMVGPDTTQAVTYGDSLPATCTTYQGYFLTDQDYADLTDFVGPDPTTPYDGTLYRCTATDTWTEWFTPLTYPHPLRGVSSEVVITAPVTSSTYPTSTTPITVGGTASGATTVTKVQWTNTEAATSDTATGTVNWSDSVGLVAGTNTIRATSTEADASTHGDTITVTYSLTPLSVAITSPTAAATYATSTTPITFGGTSASFYAVTKVQWANDEASTSDTATGTTSWSDSVALVAGTNTITATATDSNADTASDSIVITYTQPPAVVTITSPTDGASVSTGTTPLSTGGTASSFHTVTSVVWANDLTSGSGTATGTTSWTASVALTAGLNVLTYTVTDANSDTATDTLSVTYPMPATSGHWVDDNGAATWSSCSSASPLSGASACSLATANNNVAAGDTVYLRAGTYSTGIEPGASGTSGNEITYAGYQSESVIIDGIYAGVNLTGVDYISVTKVSSTDCTFGMIIEDGHYNTVSYSSFTDMTGGWDTNLVYDSSTYNWIHNSTFATAGECIGTPPSGDDDGNVITIGNENSGGDDTRFNLFEDNTFSEGGHHVVGLHGNRNVFRDNYVYNNDWSNGAGNRNLYMTGYIGYAYQNLIEGNRFAYAYPPCDDTAVGNVAMSVPDNIFRYNMAYHSNAYLLGFGYYNGYEGGDSNYIYNNTFHDAGRDIDPAEEGGALDTAILFDNNNTDDNIFKNNLYNLYFQVYSDNNGGDDSAQTYAYEFKNTVDGDPLFTNATAIEPSDLTDPTLPDFTLLEGSPAIDFGEAITTVAEADSGSGTTLVVDDAGYFQDGTWARSGLIDADQISIGSTTRTATITAINYATNTITLSAGVSRSDADSVWLYKISDGTIVLLDDSNDAGAIEYVDTEPPVAPSAPTGGSGVFSTQ